MIRYFTFIIFLILALALAYYTSFSIWWADYHASQNNWRQALIISPYRDHLTKFYAAFLQEALRQKISLPNFEQAAALAMDELDKSIERRPLDYLLRANFVDAAAAFAKIDQGYIARAEKHLAELIKINPRRQHPYFLSAKLKLAGGDKEAMIKIMEEAIALEPAAGQSHFIFSQLAQVAGEEELANKELQLAKELGY